MKKLLASALAVIIFCSCGLTALAAPARPTPGNSPAPSAEAKNTKEAEDGLTELQSRFDALSGSDKKKIYKIVGKIADLYGDLADKYADLGVISSEEANEITEMITRHVEKMQEEGRVVLGVFPRPKHRDEKDSGAA